VQFESDGAYHVSVNKQLWLTSAATFFYVNGVSHSTSDGSLKQIGEPRVITGKDTLGQWNGQTLSYTADGAKVSVSLRTYDVVIGKLAIFTQVYVTVNIILDVKLYDSMYIDGHKSCSGHSFTILGGMCAQVDMFSHIFAWLMF